MTSDSHTIEGQAKAACDDGNYERAATILLSHYGPELLSFLIARARSEHEGQDAFSVTCEDLWRGLPGFQWRSSARTWAYAVARNAAHRIHSAPAPRHLGRHEGEQSAGLSDLVAQVRSSTAAFRKTKTKDQFRALRERLEPDDQLLLILRVDRELGFAEVAQIMLGDEQGGDDARITREAARLRKRFERLKMELKRLAREAGLLDEDSPE